MDWISAVQHLRAENSPGVLITITDVRGHAPRDAGTKMVVGTDRIWGSVGGGNLEETAIDRARALIATGGGGGGGPVSWQSRLNDRARNDHGRQCCGGVVTLLFEPLPVRPTVAIFGVGHVGFELARIVSRLDISLVLVDSRAEQTDPLRLAGITDGTAAVAVHRTLLGEQVLERLPAGSHLLIMTHDHAEDFALCDAVLRRDDLGSVGLIGSSAKWSRFRTLLAEAGHHEETISRIQCPIGLPTLNPNASSKEPIVIAVGVAAALLNRLQNVPQAAVETLASGAATAAADAGLELGSRS